MAQQSEIAVNVRNAVPRRSLTQRIPWLWHDVVVARSPLPLWATVSLLVVIVHSYVALSAFAAGDLPRFLGDIRWLIITAITALPGFALGYLPGAIHRFIEGLRPWLANSDDEIAAFEASIPNLLTRFFFASAIFWGAFMVLSTALNSAGDGNPWGVGYPNPEWLIYGGYAFAPLFAYFFGGGTSVMTAGLGLFVYRMTKTLDLKRGFVFGGGKAVMRPFNRLLIVIWSTFTLPVVLLFGAGMAVYGPDLGQSTVRNSEGAVGLATAGVPFVIMFVVLALTVILPQLLMNRLLAREKREELQELHSELAAVSTPAEDADTATLVRGLQRQQYLLHQIQEARSYRPTLVDTRFVVQVGTSITGIVIANVLLRLLITQILA